MSDDRRAYLENLKEQRRELEPKALLKGPIVSAGLAALSIILAAAGVSALEPVLSVLGIAVALAGVPAAIKAFVERSISLEQLKALDAELDRIERLNNSEIEGREPVAAPKRPLRDS